MSALCDMGCLAGFQCYLYLCICAVVISGFREVCAFSSIRCRICILKRRTGYRAHDEVKLICCLPVTTHEIFIYINYHISGCVISVCINRCERGTAGDVGQIAIVIGNIYLQLFITCFTYLDMYGMLIAVIGYAVKELYGLNGLTRSGCG